MRREAVLIPGAALLLAAVGLLASPEGADGGKPKGGQLPITGSAHPDLASFDKMMLAFVKDNQVPGAALAVAEDGRLVYARGFGYADLEKKTAVQPNSLMRIASISKPITALLILLLIEQGKLRLDTPVFDLLKYKPHLAKGGKVDPRLKKVTVDQLLHHTAGWDRDKSGDPMFNSVAIAQALGVKAPAEPAHIIRYTFGKPLDFAPGTREVYSNFGYCVLGRVIEKVTGQSYEAYARKAVLNPLGMKHTRLGKTLLKHRAPEEVKYYSRKGGSGKVGTDETGPSVFAPDVGKQVPMPYGAWCIEAMDAHGGWLSSALDLLRFARSFDASSRHKLLKAATLRDAFARRKGPSGFGRKGKPLNSYYACGWEVTRDGKDTQLNTWHTGSLDGTATILVRRWDGISWAVLFNARNNQKGQYLIDLIDLRVHQAANQVKNWPKRDLFGK
jgi:N-acyl-D-amino-acid deacylase